MNSANLSKISLMRMCYQYQSNKCRFSPLVQNNLPLFQALEWFPCVLDSPDLFPIITNPNTYKPLKTDTSVRRTLFSSPIVSVLRGLTVSGSPPNSRKVFPGFFLNGILFSRFSWLKYIFFSRFQLENWMFFQIRITGEIIFVNGKITITF